jgi:predicted  nucleic acid-binding Zn-ribbon protein
MEMNGIDYTKKDIDYHIDRVKYYNDIPNKEALLHLLEEWSRELSGNTEDLENRVDELERENEELQDKVDELVDEVEDLEQENRELTQENKRLEDLVGGLEARVEEMVEVFHTVSMK